MQIIHNDPYLDSYFDPQNENDVVIIVGKYLMEQKVYLPVHMDGPDDCWKRGLEYWYLGEDIKRFPLNRQDVAINDTIKWSLNLLIHYQSEEIILRVLFTEADLDFVKGVAQDLMSLDEYPLISLQITHFVDGEEAVHFEYGTTMAIPHTEKGMEIGC